MSHVAAPCCLSAAGLKHQPTCLPLPSYIASTGDRMLPKLLTVCIVLVARVTMVVPEDGQLYLLIKEPIPQSAVSRSATLQSISTAAGGPTEIPIDGDDVMAWSKEAVPDSRTGLPPFTEVIKHLKVRHHNSQSHDKATLATQGARTRPQFAPVQLLRVPEHVAC
jgi:hypothetical protein